MFDTLSPPTLRYAIRSVFIVLPYQSVIFSEFFTSLDSDSKNTDQITYWGAGGKNASKNAELTYITCHDPIRTQLLHCGRKYTILGLMKNMALLQDELVQNLVGVSLIPDLEPEIKSNSVLVWFKNLTRFSVAVQTQNAARKPGTDANTRCC
jgi:hypothetical protein